MCIEVTVYPPRLSLGFTYLSRPRPQWRT